MCQNHIGGIHILHKSLKKRELSDNNIYDLFNFRTISSSNINAMIAKFVAPQINFWLHVTAYIESLGTLNTN